MKKMLVAVLALLMAAAASAGTIKVDYSETDNAHDLNLVGYFSGTDLNQDGWLTKDELDAWTIGYDNATLPSLNDIGSFDYVHNIWLHDALQWNQSSHDAYMTWNNWGFSVSTSNVDWHFTTTVSGDVPEPGVFALFGIGLAGLAFARRKASC